VTVKELSGLLRTRFQHQVYSILDELQNHHLISYSTMARNKIIKYSICDWRKHNTVLDYTCPCQKESGFFFIPVVLAKKLIANESCSEMDMLLDMWISAIYNDPYFDLCKLPPTVPNEEYDKRMQELAALQTKTKIYMSNSPALFAQHKTVEELSKGYHPKPIPMAVPAEQMEDLLNFQMQKQLMLMPKLISVPVKITYIDAQQREIATCGDGIEGYDITHNFGSIAGIPFIFNRKETVVVLGEVFMTPKDFE